MVQRGGYCCKYEKQSDQCPNGGWLSGINDINWVGTILIDQLNVG
jgi:hypothetical protein